VPRLPYYEEVLVCWAGIRDALEEAGKRGGEEEGEDELDCLRRVSPFFGVSRREDSYAHLAQRQSCWPHRRMLRANMLAN
jgi:hypothetical protein